MSQLAEILPVSSLYCSVIVLLNDLRTISVRAVAFFVFESFSLSDSSMVVNLRIGIPSLSKFLSGPRTLETSRTSYMSQTKINACSRNWCSDLEE